VSAARFAHDGQTIVYSAAWDRKPVELYLQRIGNPESRPMGVSNASIQAISSLDEIALLLDPYQNWNTGKLARVGMVSLGAPREILDQVNAADWSPDGRELAIIHDDAEERPTLEYPMGHPIYRQRAGFLSHARVSPDGSLVAVLDHPKNLDDSGSVVIVDRAGKSRVLASGFESVFGLDWSPDGKEVWFTGAETGLNRTLYGVSLSGRRRPLVRFMGLTTLQDVTPTGRALVIQDLRTEHVMALAPGEDTERELTWLDLTQVTAMSADGRTVVLVESGEGGGPGYSTYLRRTDGSPAVRLGEGEGHALSPDGEWVAAIVGIPVRPEIVLYPTRTGPARRIAVPGLEPQYVQWMPDGKRLLLAAGQSGHGGRLYLVDASGAEKPRVIGEEGYTIFESNSVSPDGKLAVVWGPNDRLYLHPLDGGPPRPLPGIEGGDPCGWTADGTHVYVTGMKSGVPSRVDLLDVRTGERRLWKELGPVAGANRVHVTPDGKSYAYGYVLKRHALYLVEGLK
jgi:Tol biopolymer transport system component